MLITIDRKYKKDNYTIGRLYINGNFFCNTLEDKDRGLKSTMSESFIASHKVKNETAIPTGKYKLTLETLSPKYCNNAFYKKVCGGYVPRLLDVKGFSGILIHCGNTAEDSSGCILVGNNSANGMVLESQKTFIKLYDILKSSKEDIYIEIK